MSESRHELVHRLFLEAVERPSEERAAFLDEACPDAEVRAEIEAMLVEDARAGATFDVAVEAGGAHLIAGAMAADASDLPTQGESGERPNGPPTGVPQTIGRYRILGQIGQGGMGIVYKAQQDSPDRTVALKVISASFVTPELLRRFEHEAQVLGRLQHPGIAQIFEADRIEGEGGVQPFFAMEYIDGVSITAYAREHGLGTRQRLDLIAKVCDAVAHAHQRGVIHRDLKPANILVDASGQPKILDFGVARATDGDVQAATMRTDIGQLIGTLPYMSPEQASGDPDEIDTRSDVYAMGVVAYELLTDRLPYQLRDKMIHDAVRIIREDDPTPLSSLNRTFRGDVEIIVGKALAKEKPRRYQSAGDLASDIRRYLADEPIEARPPSAGYQIGKFARRHKAWAVGAAAVFVVLVAGLIATGMAAREAIRQRDLAREAGDRASREAETKGQVADFLTNLFTVSDPGEARGNTITARELLDAGAEKIHELDDELTRTDLAETMGDVYRNLGLYEQSEALLVPALADRRRLNGNEHPDTLRTVNRLGLLYWKQGRLDEAEALFLEKLDAATRVLGEEHALTLSAKNNLGIIYRLKGQLERAASIYRSVIEATERTLGADHKQTLQARFNLGTVYRQLARYDEAEALYNQVLDAERRTLGEDHPSTLKTLRLLGHLYMQTEKYDEAEVVLDDVIAIHRRVLGDDHSETLAAYNSLGLVYINQERYAEAERLYTANLAASRRVRGEEHIDTLVVMGNMALAYRRLGRTDESIALYEETLAIQRRTLGEKHPDTAIALFHLANLYRDTGDFAESAIRFERVIEVDSKALGADHPYVADDLEEYAKLRRQMGEEAEADELQARADAIRAKRESPRDGDDG